MEKRRRRSRDTWQSLSPQRFSVPVAVELRVVKMLPFFLTNLGKIKFSVYHEFICLFFKKIMPKSYI